MFRAKRAREIMRSPADHTLYGNNIAFRPYQDAPLKAIITSIVNHYGDTIVIIFPRQSGKDEFLVNLKVYLLDLFSVVPATIVEANPTYKPQTITAILRLDTALERHPWTKGKWKKKADFMRLVGDARCAFLSGEPKASVVGATANLALIINEAQDIQKDVYTKKFEPMAASTNATRIFAGTVWTSNTLLAQERNAARQQTEKDGRQRVFMIGTDEVRESVPWYGAHVDGVIKKLGRQHPLVKTQYFNEEIDAEAGMFNAARMALMKTRKKPYSEPKEGVLYAFLLDVAGQDEAVMQTGDEDLAEDKRDAVTLSIIEIDLEDVEIDQFPSYTVINRKSWTGLPHPTIYKKIKDLNSIWMPALIVMDATGVGEGLWGFLDRALPNKVMPVKFSSKTKSEIGYAFLSTIETGRFHDATQDPQAIKQYAACVSEIKIGPAKTMKWGVPEGKRDEEGKEIHDDYVLADCLCVKLDELQWMFGLETTIIDSEI